MPKPVQMQGIPLIMSGRDIVIHSDTGSGKTLAFVIKLQDYRMKICKLLMQLIKQYVKNI